MDKWEFIDAAMEQEKVGYDIAYYWWVTFNQEESNETDKDI